MEYKLIRNSIDKRYKVVDESGFPFSDCESAEDAVDDAVKRWGMRKEEISIS